MRERIGARLGSAAPSKPLPAPKRSKVSLSRLIEAARTDPGKPGTPQSYGAGVRIVETALIDEGLLSKTRLDGHYGTDTIDAMSKWQERCGYRGRKPGQAADGIPGPDSLAQLAAKHAFDVEA
ncbi:peptidoglycan-binding protein [Streptomyces bicolor]|uniref:peptidoglycan-binding protein n=1 Tax=Streptomyces bicolor TaxID=66874 RepID=UPI0004E0C4FF|nr:peptidoglycan-binding protein [Streptomyces bicolor]